MQVKASCPAMLLTSLIGASLINASLVFAHLCDTDRASATCIVAVWCDVIGFVFLYGSIALKTWR